MGIIVLVLGESGSGKTTSLRNFTKEIGVFNVASKPLPFRNKENIQVANNITYDKICRFLKSNKMDTYIIDDSQYLMAFEMFDNVKTTGYDKFTNIAINFKKLLDAARNTKDDTIVYFLHHLEENDNGKSKIKTIGKMLDQQLTIEGLFSIVLQAKVSNNGYKFLTNSNGQNPCKSPMEMFPMEIDNDLNFVDKTIREYYGLKG